MRVEERPEQIRRGEKKKIGQKSVAVDQIEKIRFVIKEFRRKWKFEKKKHLK